jgi:hypothetical protein
MKKTIASWLRRLANWLDPVAIPPLVSRDLLDKAVWLVREIDEIKHTSSYKRAQAMKAMRLAFPDVPRRDLALAIELAVREVVPS